MGILATLADDISHHFVGTRSSSSSCAAFLDIDAGNGLLSGGNTIGVKKTLRGVGRIVQASNSSFPTSYDDFLAIANSKSGSASNMHNEKHHLYTSFHSVTADAKELEDDSNYISGPPEDNSKGGDPPDNPPCVDCSNLSPDRHSCEVREWEEHGKRMAAVRAELALWNKCKDLFFTGLATGFAAAIVYRLRKWYMKPRDGNRYGEAIPGMEGEFTHFVGGYNPEKDEELPGAAPESSGGGRGGKKGKKGKGGEAGENNF